jgi:hypothetical protein
LDQDAREEDMTRCEIQHEFNNHKNDNK